MKLQNVIHILIGIVCFGLSPIAQADPTNTRLGLHALGGNTTGMNNTAIGLGALSQDTIGYFNTGVGADVLRFNTTGFYNTAHGGAALAGNSTGSANTALGEAALEQNTTGSNNIAMGYLAGHNLTTGDFNIDIGNQGFVAEAHTIRIGNSNQTTTFIAGISGVAVTGAGVVVNAAGQLGMAPSSQRFKDAIKPMDKASEAILALKPVTFRYKREIDPKRTAQFGLVAEDVAKVNPDLVAKDAEGEIYTVRYEAVNAMLLNEFLKEHRKNEKQQKQINVLTAQLKEQAAQIQKVSAQLAAASPSRGGLEASKPAPQVVNNP